MGMWRPALRLQRFLGGCSGAVFAVAIVVASASAQAVPALPPPAHLTSEQDHQRVMDLLHISALRRGPDGDPKSPNAANVDEAKVAKYALPDPLVLKNGQKVTTAAMWWHERRPEIVEDFDREIYGRVPRIRRK